MQPQLNGMYVIKSKKILIFFNKPIESEAKIHSMSEIYSKITEFAEENNDIYTKGGFKLS